MTPIGKKGQEVDVLMSARSDSGRNEATIARAGKRRYGYDTVQVDEFLDKAHALYESEDPSLTQDQIANASFALCRNGYIIAEVDAALARLERAISDRNVAGEINRAGMEAWTARMVGLYRNLERHADRDSGAVFDRGLPGKPSYDCKQVERLISQVLVRIAGDLHLEDAGGTEGKKAVDITSDRISNVIFTQHKGKHGYDERQVDYYLSKAVELLQQMESLARLGLDGNVHRDAQTQEVPVDNAQPVAIPPAGNPAETQTIKPLIGQEQTPAWQTDQAGSTAASDRLYAPAPAVKPPETGSTDFARLHEAEQAIFEPAQQAASTSTGSGADQTGGQESPAAAQPSGSLGVLARSAGHDQVRTDAGASATPVTPPVQSAQSTGSAPTSGHDWSTPPSFAASSSRTQERSSFGSPVGGSGPLSPQTETKPTSSPWSGPKEEPVRQGKTQVPSTSEPSWARPVSEEPIGKPKSKPTEQDADSYLDSLVNAELPKMDMDLDIPDISFPVFECDDKKDQDTGGEGSQD